MIFSVLNQKGGVGKTTLSVNIAAMLAASGSKVLLVDADPQGSSLDWQAARQKESLFSVVGVARPTIHKDIHDLAAGYDHVVIDGPPRVNEQARSAVMACDKVLVPVLPSPYDVWAVDEIIRLIQEVAIYKPDLKAMLVINRKVGNTAIGRSVVDALAGYPYPVATAAIGQRVIFAESAAQGRAVNEVDPRGAAAREIQGLVQELLEL